LHAIALLAVAGALNFSLSRYLFFTALRLIGANRSSAISRTDILFAVVFGVVFFRETITLPLILGSLAIMLGAIIVNLVREEDGYRFQSAGALVAVISSLCGATASLLVKSAMKEVTSPFAATFVSYAAAAVVWLIILIARRDQRVSLLTLNRPAVAMFVLTGVLLLAGHLLGYAALAISPVSVIQPLFGTVVLFTFLLSFFLNRRLEVFNWRIFTGMLIVVAGVFLVFA
jgi:drug/metabolite transporter (DMT)-like permease